MISLVCSLVVFGGFLPSGKLTKFVCELVSTTMFKFGKSTELNGHMKSICSIAKCNKFPDGNRSGVIPEASARIFCGWFQALFLRDNVLVFQFFSSPFLPFVYIYIGGARPSRPYNVGPP